jgi:2-isopropylmalate synthase
LQIEFSQVVQGVMDQAGKELTAKDLWQLFEREYGLVATAAPQHQLREDKAGAEPASVTLTAQVQVQGRELAVAGQGTGPIEAFVNGINAALGQTVRVLDYHEHAIGAGADARAVAYLELRINEQETWFGVGIDANIVSASLKAILSGLQRAKVQAAGSSENAQSVAEPATA